MKLPCTPTQVKNVLVKFYDDSDNQKILIKTRALANEKKAKILGCRTNRGPGCHPEDKSLNANVILI